MSGTQRKQNAGESRDRPPTEGFAQLLFINAHNSLFSPVVLLSSRGYDTAEGPSFTSKSLDRVRHPSGPRRSGRSCGRPRNGKIDPGRKLLAKPRSLRQSLRAGNRSRRFEERARMLTHGTLALEEITANQRGDAWRNGVPMKGRAGRPRHLHLRREGTGCG